MCIMKSPSLYRLANAPLTSDVDFNIEFDSEVDKFLNQNCKLSYHQRFKFKIASKSKFSYIFGNGRHTILHLKSPMKPKR